MCPLSLPRFEYNSVLPGSRLLAPPNPNYWLFHLSRAILSVILEVFDSIEPDVFPSVPEIYVADSLYNHGFCAFSIDSNAQQASHRRFRPGKTCPYSQFSNPPEYLNDVQALCWCAALVPKCACICGPCCSEHWSNSLDICIQICNHYHSMLFVLDKWSQVFHRAHQIAGSLLQLRI